MGLCLLKFYPFLPSVWKLWCNPHWLSLALWAMESSGSSHHPRQSFLALTIENLLFSMWSYLSFDTCWSYWRTYYLGKTLDSSQGFFSTNSWNLLSKGWCPLFPGSTEWREMEHPLYQVEESYLLGKRILQRKPIFKNKQIICVFIWLFYIMQWGPWGLPKPWLPGNGRGNSLLPGFVALKA